MARTPLLAVTAVALLLASRPAGAETIAELRQALDRFPADQPFAASATIQVYGGTEGATRSGSTSFAVEAGPGGLDIRIAPETLATTEKEADAKKRDANAATPARTGLVAVTVFDVLDAIDAAAMLRNELIGATIVEQRAAARGGRPATLFRIRVKPTLTTQSRLVNEPKIELRLWLGAGGVPLAAERDSLFSASFLFVKGGNERKESWEYAVRGDRLYATRCEQVDRASVAGRTMVTSRVTTYSVK